MEPVILISIALLILLIIGYLFYRFYSHKKSTNQTNTQYEKKNFAKEEIFSDQKTEQNTYNKSINFDTIFNRIETSFNPEPSNDELVLEQQLIRFLNNEFPNKIVRPGHTSKGKKIDIVIDGTYAFELKVIDSEAKLVSLTDHIVKTMDDFGELGVILIDINKVSFEKISEYSQSYKSTGAKTVIKKVVF